VFFKPVNGIALPFLYNHFLVFNLLEISNNWINDIDVRDCSAQSPPCDGIRTIIPQAEFNFKIFFEHPFRFIPSIIFFPSSVCAVCLKSRCFSMYVKSKLLILRQFFQSQRLISWRVALLWKLLSSNIEFECMGKIDNFLNN